MKALKTQSGNYLVNDNDFFYAYFDNDFNFLRQTIRPEWDWAESTWDSKVKEISNLKLDEYFFKKTSEYNSKIESILNLDVLYNKIQHEASKLNVVEYNGSAPSSNYDCYLMFGSEDEPFETLVEFIAAKKQEILKGWSGTVAFLDIKGHINYTYYTDELRLSSTKLNSGNIICELSRDENYNYWDGRNADSGCNEFKDNFILKLNE